jgi:hypothetical protein
MRRTTFIEYGGRRAALTGEFVDGQTIGQLTGEFVDGHHSAPHTSEVYLGVLLPSRHGD